MLYVLNGRQVVAEIKGSSKSPVVTLAYWADTDQDLTLEECDLFYADCYQEIAQAAYEYHKHRVLAGGERRET